MKKLTSMLSALALMTFGAWAQDAAPAVEAVPAEVAAIEAPAVAEAPAPEATPAPVAEEATAVQATAPAAKAQEPDVLPVWEIIAFCVVVVGVIGLGIWKASDGNDADKSEDEKAEKGAADYFLAGRGLTWWLVGFSLLAANISTEQFVGMSGQAADWLGLAIAGYEWLAAIVLVIVAFTFLPMLLKRGVFTIPQFLEERYNGISRVTMAMVNLLILVGVPTATVIYAGANVISVYFDMELWASCLIIAGAATVYVYIGGLKACAWTDLIWGAALILGGGVVAYFAIMTLGGMEPAQLQPVVETATVASNATVDTMTTTGSQFMDGLARMTELNAGDANSAVNGIGGKLHMMREANDPVMPWSVYLLGLWIPNFFYWGLNQYIMQRTLASKSLEEGQLGVVFAAFLKLLIPFVVIIPGILAYNLFRDDLAAKADDNNAKVVKAAEDTAKAEKKEVIYNIAPSLLMRADQQQNAIARLEKNMAVVGATDEKKAELAALTTELTAIDATKVENRTKVSELANAITKLEGEVTKDARANADKYVVSTGLTAYHYDSAFATLLRKLLPGTGWAWFVLAALFGAVVSSLASMLNSASTLFTMDLYGKAKEVMGKPASPQQLLAVGKIGVLGCAVIATVIAPFLDNPAFGGIFTFIQEFQGFLSPGVLAVFLFGFFVPKCPRIFGWLGILLGAVFYASFKWVEILGATDQSFLNRMGFSFIAVCVVGLILTIVNHVKGGEAVVLTDKGIIEMKTSTRAKVFGWAVIAMTIALYIIFW
ncbi:MAG: sodium/solute symporter [Akkermansia sp.]|nr:sodium/solute symporter [Akkermansia sp.]